MTKAPTPTEMSKGESDNTNNASKKFDYTTIEDRLFHSMQQYDVKYNTSLSKERLMFVVSKGIILVRKHVSFPVQ